MLRFNQSSRSLRLVLVWVLACLLVAPVAQAKKKGDNGRYRRATSVKIAHGDASSWRDRSRGRGTGGIPAVLDKLDRIQRQLSRNGREIEALQTQLATLDANVTPCTLQRFRDGLCGPDNHPLDLMVSVCGSVGVDAGVSLKYAFTSNLDVQGGIGWKDAPDVHIVENAQVPAILPVGIPPVFVPIVLPSELAAQGSAGVGVGLDGCLAPIRIPVGKQLAEPVALAILEGLEQQALPIAESLVGQLGGGAGAGAGPVAPGLGLDALANALTAGESLRDELIQDDDSMSAFGRGPIGDLAGALPVGNTVNALLADPSVLALPGMRGGGGAGAGVGPAARLDAVAGNVCGGPLGAPLDPLCSFIETRVPAIDRVLALIPIFERIPDIVGDAVDGVRELLGPLLSNAGETVQNTRDRFCNSSLGQRRIFDLLCGR